MHYPERLRLDRHSLADLLAQIAQLGLLKPILPGIEIEKIYQLHKRVKSATEHSQPALYVAMLMVLCKLNLQFFT